MRNRPAAKAATVPWRYGTAEAATHANHGGYSTTYEATSGGTESPGQSNYLTEVSNLAVLNRLVHRRRNGGAAK
jgi:hypothetical protein